MLVDGLLRPGEPLRTEGTTIYKRMGRVCVQPSRRPGCSGKKWERTEGRRRVNTRFATMRSVTEYLLGVYAGLPVWKAGAARYAPRLTAGNYAHRVMAPYFDEEGRVADFENFQASVGEVAPAAGMTCEYDGGAVTLRWDGERGAARSRPTDTLHVIHVSERTPGHVGRARVVAVTRADGVARFEVRLAPGERLHVYPFFASADLTDFSRNGHFVVTGAEEGAPSGGPATESAAAAGESSAATASPAGPAARAAGGAVSGGTRAAVTEGAGRGGADGRSPTAWKAAAAAGDGRRRGRGIPRFSPAAVAAARAADG